MLTDDSEKYIVSIFRIEDLTMQETSMKEATKNTSLGIP
jgi:hypothetical protein